MADISNMTDAEYQQYLQQQSGLNSPQAPVASQSAPAQTTAPAARPAAKSAPVAPPASTSISTGFNGANPQADMSQAMQNVTGAVTQGQTEMAPNMPFPQAKSPNSDMYSLATPYAVGAGGLLAALYGGKKALDLFGKKKEEEGTKVEPTMEAQESHEDYMKRMEREERLHQVRLAKAKADEAEAKIQATQAAPAQQAPVQPVSQEEEIAALLQKKHPEVAKALREGRVSIADGKAMAAAAEAPKQAAQATIATQQTQPMANAGQAPATAAPVEQAPLQGATQAQPVTAATEAGGQAATVDQNAPKSKTEAPKVGVAPATELTTGSGMPAYQGTGEPGLRKKEMAGLHELGKDFAFIPNGQNMDILRNAIGQENYTKLLKESGGFPATPQQAYEQAREINKSLGRDSRSVAKEAGKELGETTSSITKMVGKNKMVKMGGVAGALISLADLAKASPNESAESAGESAMSMLPPVAQLATYSKEAGAPTLDTGSVFERNPKLQELESIRPGFNEALKNFATSKEGNQKSINELINNPPEVFTEREKLQSEMQKRSGRGGRISGAIAPPSRK